MRLLITGVAGFIGAAVAERLLERGDTVVGIDNLNDYYSPQLKRDRVARVSAAHGNVFTFKPIDFADRAALGSGLEGVQFDRIVHLGAQAGVRYSIENPHAYVQFNLVGHMNLLELARIREVDHMVYASSSSVYGRSATPPFAVDARTDQPSSLYAATKKADELMSESHAHIHKLPLTGLRFFTVYGPWGRPDMMMWLFSERILKGQPIAVFNRGEMHRDFTYIDDIVTGVLAALDRPPADDGAVKAGGSTSSHAIYNLGNNRSEHLMDVIKLLEEACGKKAEIDFQPFQPGDVEKTCADLMASQRDLGYAPTTNIDAGVPKFVQWFREYHNL